jgi:hypothetical protein
MRGLAILTHRAQKQAHPGRYVDRRTLPQCAYAGCRRKVSALPDGNTEHCYDHASQAERAAYVSAWSKAA